MAATVDGERLRRLGRGEPIARLCADEGWSRDDFDAWWAERLREHAPDILERAPDIRAPEPDGRGAREEVGPGTFPGDGPEIIRDGRGIPHVFASDDLDLFRGYGYAMGQDRLFQLDLQRRKGRGTAAALLGSEGVELDRVAHTIGFPNLAAAELERMDAETRALFEAFSDGVETAARSCGDRLPIEYSLLGAEWEPWSALDSVACAVAFRWQFTGRPHVRAGPELLRRHLGDERLVATVLASQREADTPILPPDAPYPPGSRRGAQAMDDVSIEATGSNNWVVAGTRTRSGKPVLGSDPHMPYQWTSAFYEVGLHGGTFDAVGAGFVGVPGLIFGRSRDLAWCFTNNICSVRDLYQERPLDGTSPTFEHDGRPEPARVEHVTIAVRDADDVGLRVVRTRNGPLVDDILPPQARGTGPVSMRWLGSEPCDWPAAQLRLARARSVGEAIEAIEGWLVPTFSLLFADASGGIGYAATGRIPLRDVDERGYRPGWDPAHAWTGLIPTEGMPRARDPERGWLASANNRPAPDDWPYPLSGTWDEGYRARYIGRLIEDADQVDLGDMARMHADVRSLRAEAFLPDLLALFEPLAEDRLAHNALALLRGWDLRAAADSAGAAVHVVLFTRWCQAVMAERVADREIADYLANWGLALGARLAREDDLGWFAPGRREAAARDALREAVAELAAVLGPDPSAWRWGAIHRQRLRHPLGGRGDLGALLDKAAIEVGGDLVTLSNSGYDATRPDPARPGEARGWEATSGACYRLEVDMGESPPAAWTITGESQSGVPGTAHYDDQREDWRQGRVHRLPLDRVEVERMATRREILAPASMASAR